jgi:ABC-type nitrate/sulfonate/bicarbonate transport system ATPase subunit
MADAAKPIALQVSNVSKAFQIGAQTVMALSHVDLTVPRGEFVCLVGASGCGKTTLLRIIAGFETASSGEVKVGRTVVTGPGPDRGMVFQDYALFPWLTVRENVAFGPRERGVPKVEARERVDEFINMVGLDAFADRYPHQLSGGMKQRVAIARVLANESQFLLMDEPFGALDALTRERLQEELLDIWQRTHLTVLFVTHSMEEAVLLSDRVVVMTAGPGKIESDYTVALERPRDVSSPEFNDIRRALSRKLTSHVSKRVAA